MEEHIFSFERKLLIVFVSIPLVLTFAATYSRVDDRNFDFSNNSNAMRVVNKSKCLGMLIVVCFKSSY